MDKSKSIPYPSTLDTHKEMAHPHALDTNIQYVIFDVLM